MNNNDNHNGKEVPRDQTLRNGQKENGKQAVNKIKKNSITENKDARPGEPKKIVLNTNNPTGNQKKSTSKGHVIKLEDKGNRTHSEDTSSRENRRSFPKTSPGNATSTPTAEPPVYHQASEYINSRTSNEKFSIKDKTGQWLLIAAAIFLIAWAIVFFYYHIGGNSHMLLAFAVICAIISLAGKKKKN